MAEGGPSNRESSISSDENNISMLLDKLKELRMNAENPTSARVFGRVESKYSLIVTTRGDNLYVYYIVASYRLAE